MKGKNLLVAAVVLLSSGEAVFAGGTTATFLKLGSGARATGLGGAFTAVSNDINAISYNPAGLADLKKCEMGFTRAELGEGMNYNFLGYSRPAAKGTVGLALNYLGQSSMEGRGANREVSGNFGASDTAINLAYGRAFGERSGLGVNFKYITSRIAGESANGWAVDAGWQYKTPVRGLGMGFAVQNIGPEIKFMDEASSLPLTARVGVGYTILDNVLFSFDVNKQINEKRTVLSFGSEYVLFNSFSMRAGYLKNTISGGNSLAGSGGLNAGFGFKLRVFSLDYAVTPFGDIGKTHRISLGAGF